MVTMILIGGMNTNVMARSNEEYQTENQTELVNAATDMLEVLSNDPQMFGITNFDKNSLYLCEGIPTYNISEGIRTKKADVVFYPVMSRNKIIASIVGIIGVNGSMNYSFDVEVAKMINENRKSEFIIVCDQGETFIEKRNSSNKKSNGLTVTGLTKISLGIKLSNTLMSTSMMSYNSYPSAKTNYVDFIGQGSENLCWAACTAMYAKYEGRTPAKTAAQVADLMGIAHDVGGDVFEIQNALSSIFRISSLALTSNISNSDYISLINDDEIIIAAFNPLDGTEELGHVVIMCGYRSSSNGCVAIIRDPNTTSYRMAYQTTLPTTPVYSGYYLYVNSKKMYWINTVK